MLLDTKHTPGAALMKVSPIPKYPSDTATVQMTSGMGQAVRLKMTTSRLFQWYTPNTRTMTKYTARYVVQKKEAVEKKDMTKDCAAQNGTNCLVRLCFRVPLPQKK